MVVNLVQPFGTHDTNKAINAENLFCRIELRFSFTDSSDVTTDRGF